MKDERSATPQADRLTIARALREMAGLLDASGQETFKARAYARGAEVLERLDADLGELVARRRLTTLQGIGPALAAMITDLYQTGRSQTLEDQRQRVPAIALELSRIPRLGLDKIAALHAALGVKTIDDLEAACVAGRVRSVKGMGEKTERRILDAIRRMRAPEAQRVLLPEALADAAALSAHLRKAPVSASVEAAGDLRRWAESLDELSLVVAADRPPDAMKHALRAPLLAEVTSRDQETFQGRLASGLSVRVQVVSRAACAPALLRATGSAAHVEHLERLARERGVRLEGESEAEIYARLGLPFIPPELREGEGEIEAAMTDALPADLVTAEDLKGLVHCHTVYSDGQDTVEQMARAADALGMEYMTITDHSPSAAYAGGLSVDRLKTQWEEIARVQERVSVKLLRGTESDILADGSLDYPDAILEQLDVVIASIHRRHRMDANQMTERLVRTMALPCFKIWGHALGRLILSRPPVECRVEEVLDAAATGRAAVEINGDPRRLDLPPRWLKAARERGLRFVVSTDAHSVGELGNVRYGIPMARRGWVRRGDVLNTRSAAEFVQAVAPAGRR
ncbi:MAG: DNA polymerase/3'-5' exonuclease PolX [Candidatus Rokuibacteriota bacterium]|nr:MAG: DNA polymerase/3'-5' exonuclease PolX [Candidatus Rokubacteria bacterium]